MSSRAKESWMLLEAEEGKELDEFKSQGELAASRS